MMDLLPGKRRHWIPLVCFILALTTSMILDVEGLSPLSIPQGSLAQMKPARLPAPASGDVQRRDADPEVPTSPKNKPLTLLMKGTGDSTPDPRSVEGHRLPKVTTILATDKGKEKRRADLSVTDYSLINIQGNIGTITNLTTVSQTTENVYTTVIQDCSLFVTNDSLDDLADAIVKRTSFVRMQLRFNDLDLHPDTGYLDNTTHYIDPVTWILSSGDRGEVLLGFPAIFIPLSLFTLSLDVSLVSLDVS